MATPSKRAKAAAAARLRKLDDEYESDKDREKRNKLRAIAHMGSRGARRKASTELSSLPRQQAMAKKMREENY